MLVNFIFQQTLKTGIYSKFCTTDESGSDTDIGSTSTCSSTSDLVSDFHPNDGATTTASNDIYQLRDADEVDNVANLNHGLLSMTDVNSGAVSEVNLRAFNYIVLR